MGSLKPKNPTRMIFGLTRRGNATYLEIQERCSLIHRRNQRVLFRASDAPELVRSAFTAYGGRDLVEVRLESRERGGG